MYGSANRVVPMRHAGRRSISIDDPFWSRDAVLVIGADHARRAELGHLLDNVGYRASFSEDLEQTLKAIHQTGVQLVIIDAREWEEAGLALCRSLRDDIMFGRPHVMLLSEDLASLDVNTATNAGVDDFLFTPLHEKKLKLHLQNGMRMLQLHNQAEHRSLQLADALNREADTQKVLHDSQRAAAKAQRELLGEDLSPFPELEISSLFLPADTVSSDSYNCIKLDEEHLAFYMIDATGNELASVMLAHTIKQTLSKLDKGISYQAGRAESHANDRQLPACITPPHEVVGMLNTYFAGEDTAVDYFTMVYGVINVRTGAGELCQAGHPHPIIVSGRNHTLPFGNGGFSVGLASDASYDTIGFQLEAGDRLFIYSDGLTDCRIRTSRCFGIQRLIALLETSRSLSLPDGLALVKERLDRWRKKKPSGDDISLLAIGRRKTRTPL